METFPILFFLRERDAYYIKTAQEAVHLDLTVKTLSKTEITTKPLLYIGRGVAAF